MKREIKFRQRILNADGSFKRFFYWGFTDNEFISPARQLGHPSTAKDSDQFTGLLDKNGKEIYEGDIIEYCRGDDHDHLLSHITFPILIEYSNVWAQFGWSDGGAWFSLDHFRIIQIFGNIYENPELLK